MSIFANSSASPLPSHKFLVFIGAVKIPFSKVSSIEMSTDTEILQEGGENRYAHSLSKPASTEKILVLERGVNSNASVLSEAIPLLLQVGSFFSFIIIAVLDQQSLPKKIYVVTDAVLKKRSLSELNAMSGEVFVESIEFAYKDLTEIPGTTVMFSAVESAQRNTPSKPNTPKIRFTKPVDPKPAPKPKPTPFTLPRNQA